MLSGVREIECEATKASYSWSYIYVSSPGHICGVTQQLNAKAFIRRHRQFLLFNLRNWNNRKSPTKPYEQLGIERNVI